LGRGDLFRLDILQLKSLFFSLYFPEDPVAGAAGGEVIDLIHGANVIFSLSGRRMALLLKTFLFAGARRTGTICEAGAATPRYAV